LTAIHAKTALSVSLVAEQWISGSSITLLLDVFLSAATSKTLPQKVRAVLRSVSPAKTFHIVWRALRSTISAEITFALWCACPHSLRTDWQILSVRTVPTTARLAIVMVTVWPVMLLTIESSTLRTNEVNLWRATSITLGSRLLGALSTVITVFLQVTALSARQATAMIPVAILVFYKICLQIARL